MGGGTPTPRQRADARRAGARRPAGYARRRFGVFVAGLATLAVVTLAFSRALGSGAPAAAGGFTVLADGAAGSDGLPSPSPQPDAATSPGTAAQAAAASGSSTPVTPAPSLSSTAAPQQLNRCSRAYVVLSLFTSQTGAGAGAVPQFDVDVVSTQVQPCKFNVGGWHLALVIKKGTATIWSSADCAAGPGSLITELRRGVPTVLQISWDRQRSVPGCAGPPSRAPAGTYSAAATDDGLTSNAETFSVR